MIVFNTIKKAEHWIKWYSKLNDYQRGGYDWESVTTYIDGDLVKTRRQGDGCGCGCDNHLFDYTIVHGRIKKFDTKSIRGEKIAEMFR
jgi:hypothetical protein